MFGYIIEQHYCSGMLSSNHEPLNTPKTQDLDRTSLQPYFFGFRVSIKAGSLDVYRVSYRCRLVCTIRLGRTYCHSYILLAHQFLLRCIPRHRGNKSSSVNLAAD